MYLFKACAFIERTVSNTCDAVRDFNAGKAGAIIERSISNACDAIAIIVSWQSQFCCIAQITG